MAVHPWRAARFSFALTDCHFTSDVGGLLGSAVVYLLYNRFSSSTLNVASMSQAAFEFSVTPRLLLIGLGSALLLGTVGGLLAALRAVRVKILYVVD